jgi:hypothetical protein
MSEVGQPVAKGRKVRRRHVRTNTPKAAFTLPQLAADGPLSRSALYREIREGRLIIRRAGKSTIVLAADWDSFLQSLPPVDASTITEPVGPREARARKAVATGAEP